VQIMDIFFSDPNDIPLPPEKMEIRELKATPYDDAKRILVELEITPFQQRPNLEILIFNQNNRLVSSLSVVEAIEKQMTFTLHLRESDPVGHYNVQIVVFYTEIDQLDAEDGPPIKDMVLENKQIVATSEVTFQIT